MPGVQPGLRVPVLSQPGSVSQVLLSTDRGAARESEAKLSGEGEGEPLATLSGPQMRPEARWGI